MELYALDDEIAQLEAALTSLTGPDRLPILMPLAWYLRQRDSKRALALADEASSLLDAAPDGPETTRQRARLDLVRAEIAILMNRYDEADLLLARTTAAFTALDDPIGLGDAALVAYLRHQIDGVTQPAGIAATRAQQHYARGGDRLRSKAADTWLLLLLAYDDADAAERQLATWEGATPEAPDDDGVGPVAYADEHPALASVLLSARAVVHRTRNEISQALRCAARASQRGQAGGLIRHAIAAANNAGWYMLELGDLDGSAEWMDREDSAARATGWPSVLAFAAMRLGELLRQLGQTERSREVLEEAIGLYESMPSGINKGVAYRVFGRTLLELGRSEEALAAYEAAIGMFRTEHYHERLSNALIGAARALSLAGRPAEAVERIEEARTTAADHRIKTAEIELDRAMAEIHERHPLPPPPGMTAPTTAVHYLERALAAGATIGAWQPPVDLLAGLAAAWEAAGDTGRALDYLKRTVTAERNDGRRKAANRTLALQIRYETEQTRLEMLHNRQLARAEAERAAALERTLDELREAQAELEMRRAEFERLSLLDPMTAIANRRHFNDRAAAEIARARREGSQLGVVMFDIDHFKQVNDRFGHAAGDVVIRRVVELARGQLRASDFIARLGGEEFALLVPSAMPAGLRQLTERIREEIAGTAIDTGIPDGAEPIAVTVSFGLALLRPDDATIEAVLMRADAALYQAKRQGRNRVMDETSLDERPAALAEELRP